MEGGNNFKMSEVAEQLMNTASSSILSEPNLMPLLQVTPLLRSFYGNPFLGGNT